MTAKLRLTSVIVFPFFFAYKEDFQFSFSNQLISLLSILKRSVLHTCFVEFRNKPLSFFIFVFDV